MVRAERGSVSICTRAMIPKIVGIHPPHRKPSTISRIALVWIEPRSGAGGSVMGVLPGRVGSVPQRAAMGVPLEGGGPGEDHDALDETPDGRDRGQREAAEH